jgi:hypothetical protein
MYFDTDLTIKEANIPQSSLIRRFRNVIVRKSGYNYFGCANENSVDVSCFVKLNTEIKKIFFNCK